MDKACAMPDGPAKTLVYQRMAQDETFRTAIARARVAQQDAIIDETVDMADAATPENWQVVRMQIWARQWRAGKLAPKVYGEKVTQEVTGGDSPIRVVIEMLGDAAPPRAEHNERDTGSRVSETVRKTIDFIG